MSEVTTGAAAGAAPVVAPRPGRLPGGPLSLTRRQSAVAAIALLVVGLGAALGTPIAAALEARRVTPPGGVQVGQAVVLPADGWSVQAQQPDAVLLTRGGAQMVVRWEPGPPADPRTGLSELAAATQEAVPDARNFGGVRQFSTPTGDPGYLEPFGAPGTTGAIGLVQAPSGEALVQALAPSTTFGSVSDDLVSMITGLRVRGGGAA